jgi:cytochrome P450
MKFLGDGIFNVDGTKWSQARALLRPQFLKQRISDLQVFDEHIMKMISLLPKVGQTVDLMEWWYRFTLDASTHYLFGESVGSLANSEVNVIFSRLNFRIRLLRRSLLFNKFKLYGID